MRRDKDDDDIMTAREFASKEKSGFESTTLNMPEGASRFKLDSTKTRYIDIIPFVVGRGNDKADKGQTHYERTYYVHKGLGADGKQREVCLAKTFKKPCPICEMNEKNKASGLYDDDTWKKYLPKVEQLYNVIDAEAADKGIQIWPINQFYFGKQLVVACEALDDDDDEQKFASPMNGFTLKLTVEENKFMGNTSYKVARVDFKKRKKQYKSSIKEEAYCLDDLIKKRSYKELKKVFQQTLSGGTDEDDSDDDSDSNKKGSKMAKAKKAAAKFSVGDSVEWDEVDGECVIISIAKNGKTATIEDEEGEEHEKVAVSELTAVKKTAKKKAAKKKPAKPAKKKASKKSKDEDEDEEDDDEEDEDDDDDSDDDDEDEDDESDDEDEDEDEDDDDESDDEDDDDEEDDDSDDDEDDDEDDDDEDEDEDDDDEDDDEDDEPAPKKKKAVKKKKK